MNSDLGPIHIVQPGQGQSHWQPVPANGFIDILMAPDMVAMETKFGFGRQTVAPGGHVREHAHDRNEELIHVLSGQGRDVKWLMYVMAFVLAAYFLLVLMPMG